MGIDILFGVIETREQDKAGSVKVSAVRKKAGTPVETTIKYIDIIKASTKNEILSAFIGLIDSIDIMQSPVEFRIRFNSVRSEWIIEREWREKSVLKPQLEI